MAAAADTHFEDNSSDEGVSRQSNKKPWIIGSIAVLVAIGGTALVCSFVMGKTDTKPDGKTETKPDGKTETKPDGKALQGSKLYYFDMEGVAEPIRIAMSKAGVELEEKRIALEPELKEWKAFKADKANAALLPFEHIPVLQLKDKTVLAETDPLYSYVAKNTGLYPENDLDAARMEMIMSHVDTIVGVCRTHVLKPVVFDGKPFPEADLKKIGVDLKKLLEQLNDVVALNKTPGYSVGDKRTMVDLVIYNLVANLRVAFKIPDGYAEKCDKLKAVTDKVGEEEFVVKYNKDKKDNKKEEGKEAKQ